MKRRENNYNINTGNTKNFNGLQLISLTNRKPAATGSDGGWSFAK